MATLEDKGIGKAQLRNATWIINHLARNADINSPKSVEAFIRKPKHKDTYKSRLAYIYKQYCEYKGLKWKKPKFSRDTKEIRVPTREYIEMIIANSGKTLATKLTLSYKTGLRPCEVHDLKVKDIDFEQRYVYPNTAKHGAPRRIHLDEQILQLLKDHIAKNNLQPQNQLFNGDSIRYGKEYREIRNRLAKKLNKPAIHEIRLYDLRHYFATVKYYETDLKMTQYLMGHKHSNTTDIYTHLITTDQESNFIRRATKDTDEAIRILDAGFTHELTTPDGTMIFKKRK